VGKPYVNQASPGEKLETTKEPDFQKKGTCGARGVIKEKEHTQGGRPYVPACIKEKLIRGTPHLLNQNRFKDPASWGGPVRLPPQKNAIRKNAWGHSRQYLTRTWVAGTE